MSKMAKAQSGNLEIVCTICIDALVEHNGSSIIVTECGHPYHDSCLREWLYQANLAPPYNDPRKMLAGKCPVCSTIIWFSECRPLFLTAETTLSQTVSLEQFNKLKVEHTKLQKEHSGCTSKVEKAFGKTVSVAKPGRVSLMSAPSTAPPAASLRRITRSVSQQLQQPVLSGPAKPIPSRSAKATVSSSRPPKPTVAPVVKPSGPPKPNPSRSVKAPVTKPTKPAVAPAPKPSSSSNSRITRSGVNSSLLGAKKSVKFTDRPN